VTLQRKKSLPDVQQLPINNLMSREEVSVLGSARREEVRRLQDESERYKANPLLYLVSPQVKVTLNIEFIAICEIIYCWKEKEKQTKTFKNIFDLIFHSKLPQQKW
jgi:hypothetical protein